MKKFLKEARYLEDVDVIEIRFVYPNGDDKFVYVDMATTQVGIMDLVKSVSGIGKDSIIRKGRNVIEHAASSKDY